MATIYFAVMNKNELYKMKISYPFLSVVYKFFDFDKRTRYFGTDVPIFHSEIHMLKAIKENEGIHVAGLANYLGVTKGSISETAIKLEKKGLIIKEKDIKNQSKLMLKLTPKGETAHRYHVRFHEEFDDLLVEILIGESEENIEFLKSFLSNLESKIHDFEEKVTE